MKLKLLVCIGLLSQSAFAGKLMFDARLDGQGQTYNDDASVAGFGHNNFRYIMRTARLDYLGNLNDKTSVRARAILNTTQGTMQTRDSLNGTIDLFYVNHKLNDNFALTAGKFASEMGGYENQVTSPDVYLFSTAFNGGSTDLNTVTKTIYTAQTGNSINTFTWANTGTTRYYTGAKATYAVENHEIAIHTADLTADDTTGTSSNNASQTRTMTGAVYKGSFADKLVQPIISYHEGYVPGGSIDQKALFATLGSRFNWDGNTIDADYIVNTFKSRTLVSTTYKDDSIKSLLVAWSKAFGEWTPKVKLERSEMNAAEQKIFDVNGYCVAIEYRPVAEENFRYHLAYIAKDYIPVTGNTLKEQDVIIGTRISADILK